MGYINIVSAYFIIVRKVYDGDRRIQGVWGINKKGKRFIEGKITVPKGVITYRGDPIEYKNKKDRVHITNKKYVKYKQKEDYARECRIHKEKEKLYFLYRC